MFSYIRWFSAISFLLIIMAAILVGRSFKEIGSHDLIEIVGNDNTSLAQEFMNTTWKKYSDGVTSYHRFRVSGVPVEEWKNYKGYKEMLPALDEFSKAVFKHFEDIPIASISIYTPDGTQLISTDQSRIVLGQDSSSLLSATPPQASREDGTFEKALSGEDSNVVIENASIVGANGNASKGVLIKTVVPVLNDCFLPVVVNVEDNNKQGKCKNANQAPNKDSVEAVIEISYDVTKQWKRLDLFQQIGTYGILGIFIVVISTLLYTSNKAESIIARQHETNLELAAQAASAQAENRDKSQFLANVSHELRTPLNAIIGFSEFIKSERSGPIGNVKYGEYIKDIHDSGVHLLSLINDILDYSKAEADKLELEVGEVDATKSVKNCMRLVSPRAEMAQVQLFEEIPREHFILKTDAKKLKQVMLNLLSNAVKFTPAKGSVTVTMWQNVINGSLSIEVKDTGIGIAPKDISRAMAPFGQVDNTLSRKYEGTGLGLPLTRKFVEIMGGTFNIQSEEGKGTVITVTLPREAKGKPAQPDAEATETPIESPPKS